MGGLYENIRLRRFGNSYGGFEIAVDYLSSEPIIYSFGIGEDLSFSCDILKELRNVLIYAFDMTPRAIQYVNNNENVMDKRFHFIPICISDEDGSRPFYLPKNDEYVSGSLEKYSELKDESIDVNTKRLETIMREMSHSSIDVLKMDIEGSEFKVIPDILKSIRSGDIKIGQICLETHERFYPDGVRKWEKLKDALNQEGYEMVTVPDLVQEHTFVKIDQQCR